MPAPRELPQQIPANRAKARMQKTQGAKFWCKSSGVRGGMAMDEIDTFIMCLFQTWRPPAKKLEEEKTTRLQGWQENLKLLKN